MTSTFDSVDPVLFKTVSHVTATLTSKHPKLGDRVTVDGNQYIFVYNGGGEQISKGYGAVAMVGCTEFTCTVSSVSGDVPLGVCLHATLTTDTYGWLLTKGYGVAYTTGAISTGGNLMMDVDGGFAAATSHAFGQATSAHAGGVATGPVYWHCP